jgi:hypothetical protein
LVWCAGGLGKQGQLFGDGGCRDHQVSGPPARLGADGDDRRRYPAVDAGRLGAERHRVELALATLQDLQASCPLGVLVVQVCLLLLRTSWGPADSSARVMALIAISSDSPAGSIQAAQDEDVGIQ